MTGLDHSYDVRGEDCRVELGVRSNGHLPMLLIQSTTQEKKVSINMTSYIPCCLEKETEIYKIEQYPVEI